MEAPLHCNRRSDLRLEEGCRRDLADPQYTTIRINKIDKFRETPWQRSDNNLSSFTFADLSPVSIFIVFAFLLFYEIIKSMSIIFFNYCTAKGNRLFDDYPTNKRRNNYVDTD